MANQSDHSQEPELQLELVVLDTAEEKSEYHPIDLISQYRILDKKCDEVLKKIYHRRTVKKN
jgi:hypothetical protein